MDGENQNPAPDTGTNDIENIMGGMQGAEPTSKPTDNGGEKDAGNKPNADGKSGSEVQHPAWMSQIGDIAKDAAAAEKLGKFEKLGDLANGYLELEKKLGSSIVKPGDDASAEEKENFYKLLGKPESADKYSIKGDDAKLFREIAYKNNLTDEQATALYQSFKEVRLSAIEAQEQAFEQQAHETQAALQKEYGKEYSTKIEMLKRGIAAYGGENLGAKLQKAGLLGDYEIIKHFITLGEMSAEAGSPGNTGGKASSYKSIEEGGTLNFGDVFDKK